MGSSLESGIRWGGGEFEVRGSGEDELFGTGIGDAADRSMDDDLEDTLKQAPPAEPPEEEEPIQKVTDVPHGAKRDGYFKRRDYEE